MAAIREGRKIADQTVSAPHSSWTSHPFHPERRDRNMLTHVDTRLFQVLHSKQSLTGNSELTTTTTQGPLRPIVQSKQASKQNLLGSQNTSVFLAGELDSDSQERLPELGLKSSSF